MSGLSDTLRSEPLRMSRAPYTLSGLPDALRSEPLRTSRDSS